MAPSTTDERGSQLEFRQVLPGLAPQSGPEELVVRPNKALRRDGQSPYLIGVLVAGVLLSSSAVFLGYYFGAVRDKQPGTVFTAVAKVPQAPVKSSAAPVSPSNPSPTTTPSRPATRSLNIPGFVLQVGAMRQEENARKLADALRQRSLPVFVFRRGGLYRVAVGPYSDAHSTVTVKDQLDKQGFQAFLRRWFAE
ncbi:MAG: SPOR domain-containing protein [Candidatus Acidiferrales bacterium]